MVAYADGNFAFGEYIHKESFFVNIYMYIYCNSHIKCFWVDHGGVTIYIYIYTCAKCWTLKK